MALTPISLFQSQGNGIAQFLQGGQNALASALNNVIQVGRDTVNKQFAQERDFLSEQKRVEDLAQRRGENLQQQSNFDRTFARNLFVTDREFADRNDDQARAEKRMDAQDLFRQTDADRNYDIRKSEAESLQESRDLQIKESERVAAKREKEDQFYKDINAQPSAAAPDRMSAEFLLGPVSATATATTGTPEERLAEATIRMKAAEEARDTENFTKFAREKAAAEAEIARKGGNLTPAEYRAQVRFNQGQEDRKAKELEVQATRAKEKTDLDRAQANAQIAGLVRTYPDTFRSAHSYLPPEGSPPPEGTTAEQLKAARAEAVILDQERETVEVQAALDAAKSVDYVAKVLDAERESEGRWPSMNDKEKREFLVQKLGLEAVERREKLYNLAKKTALADGTKLAAAEPAAEKSPVDAYVDRVVTGANDIEE